MSVDKLVPISEKAYKTLLNLSEENEIPMTTALETAIKEYDRHLFFKAAEKAYRELQSDPVAWAEELAERKLWETTLMDGIDTDEIWNEDGTVTILSTGERFVAWLPPGYSLDYSI